MKSVYLLVLSSLILFCSTAPDFERDNENDPESSAFSADISSFTAKLAEGKTVQLRWKDESNFETGFYIAKSYSGTSAFEVIDTIQANLESYIDDSRSVTDETVYRIAAFNESNTDPESWAQSRIKFAFFSITSITTNGASITINWDTTGVFADLYQIERRYSNQSEWTSLSTVSGTTTYTYEEPANNYSSNFRVVAKIESLGEHYSIRTTPTKGTTYNLPKNITYNILNEAELEVAFEDVSNFEDQFIVYQRFKENRCCDIPWGPYIPIDTIANNSTVNIAKGNYFGTLEFSMRAINASNQSLIIGAQKFNYAIQAPYFTGSHNINHISESSFRVSWNHNNDIIDRYHFEIYLSDFETDEIIKQAIVSKDVFTYTFHDLEPSKKYKYWVTTYNSPAYNSSLAEYFPTMESTRSYNVSNSAITKSWIIPNANAAYFITSTNGSSIIKSTLENGESISISDNAENHSNFANSILSDFIISDNENDIAVIRRYPNNSNGSNQNWLFVSQIIDGETVYSKKKVQGEHYTETIKLLTPIHSNRVIFAHYDGSSTGIFEYSLVQDTFSYLASLEQEFINDVYIDRQRNQAIIAGTDNVWVFNWNENELSLLKENLELEKFNIAIRNESLFGFSNSTPFLIDLSELTLNRYSLRLSFDEALIIDETLVTAYRGINCYYNFATTALKFCREIEYWNNNPWWETISKTYYEETTGKMHVLFSSGRFASYEFENKWVYIKELNN